MPQMKVVVRGDFLYTQKKRNKNGIFLVKRDEIVPVKVCRYTALEIRKFKKLKFFFRGQRTNPFGTRDHPNPKECISNEN